MTYNNDQWIESFEGRLQILRPHLSGRVLESMSNAAWHSRGTQGEDPIAAANAASADLDARAKKGQRPPQKPGRVKPMAASIGCDSR